MFLRGKGDNCKDQLLFVGYRLSYVKAVFNFITIATAKKVMLIEKGEVAWKKYWRPYSHTVVV